MWCPSDRVVLNEHMWRRLGAISPPIALQPPPRPPFGLLLEPRRARVKEFIIAHHEDVGEDLAVSSDVASLSDSLPEAATCERRVGIS